MNSLSWFLYFAGVVENVQPLFIVFGLVGLIVCGIIAIYCHEQDCKFPWQAWAFGWLAGLSIFIGALLPSKNTMYAIAASELGEEVINSNIGTKVSQALEQWIDKQLEQKK